MSTQFDKEYYQRFYFDPRTAVISRAEMKARANLIAAYANHIGLPVRRMLDAGCGIGLLRTPLQRALSARRVHGARIQRIPLRALRLDAGLAGGLVRGSVRSHGLLRRAAVSRRPHGGARDREPRRGSRAACCISRRSPTRDWRENCDRTRTDRDVFLRDAAWYRQRLRKDFKPSGVGFWVRRGAPLTTWEMETAAI